MLAKSLELSPTAISNYLDILEGVLLIRRLQPYYVNIRKRLVRSPKVYIRDSGILHRLADLTDESSLETWANRGNSFEGLVIEEMINAASTSLTGPRFFFLSNPSRCGGGPPGPGWTDDLADRNQIGHRCAALRYGRSSALHGGSEPRTGIHHNPGRSNQAAGPGHLLSSLGENRFRKVLPLVRLCYRIRLVSCRCNCLQQTATADPETLCSDPAPPAAAAP